MGLFRKESQTRFLRNEAGEVVDVVRGGDKPARSLGERLGDRRSRTPVSDSLLSQQKPSEKKTSFTNRFVAGAKRIDSGIVKYNRTRNPMRGNYNPFGSMFDSGQNYKERKPRSSSSKKYAIVGGKAYPIAGSKKKKSKSKRRRSSGFDMFDNWGF